MTADGGEEDVMDGTAEGGRQRLTGPQRRVLRRLHPQASVLLDKATSRIARRLAAKGYARECYTHNGGAALFIRVDADGPSSAEVDADRPSSAEVDADRPSSAEVDEAAGGPNSAEAASDDGPHLPETWSCGGCGGGPGGDPWLPDCVCSDDDGWG